MVAGGCKVVVGEAESSNAGEVRTWNHTVDATNTSCARTVENLIASSTQPLQERKWREQWSKLSVQ
jgi:hypothetical protein